jgi:hypothetical protein
LGFFIENSGYRYLYLKGKESQGAGCNRTQNRSGAYLNARKSSSFQKFAYSSFLAICLVWLCLIFFL